MSVTGLLHIFLQKTKLLHRKQVPTFRSVFYHRAQTMGESVVCGGRLAITLHIHTSPVISGRPLNPRNSLVPWAHRSRTEEMQILGMKCRGGKEQGDPRNSALSKGFVGGRKDGGRVWGYRGARSKITFAMETGEDKLRKAGDGNTVWNAFWSVRVTIFC
jgi:hypothetical protein